eukprot:1330042-Pleurochrysis_carterae.AAC.1
MNWSASSTGWFHATATSAAASASGCGPPCGGACMHASVLRACIADSSIWTSRMPLPKTRKL